jgi:hypothetical protein
MLFDWINRKLVSRIEATPLSWRFVEIRSENMTAISKSRVGTFLYFNPSYFLLPHVTRTENGERFHKRMVEESQDARVRLHHKARSYIISVQSLSNKKK